MKMAFVVRRFGWVAAVALVGCPADKGSDDGGGEGTDAGTSESGDDGGTVGQSDTSAGSQSGSGDDGSDDGSGDDGSGDDGSGDDGSGDDGGASCPACDDDTWCDWSADSCGDNPTDRGTCEPRPEGCDAFYMPVCACDGEVYSNACEAQAAGRDIDAFGECDPPRGEFACGNVFCTIGAHYCQQQVSDVGGIPDGFSCLPLPGACGNAPTCDCLAEEPCADFSCEMTDDGGFLLVCPGG